MVPTSLPDLPKPSRTLGKSQKPEFLNPKFYRAIQGKIFIFLIDPFLRALFLGTPREMDRWTDGPGPYAHIEIVVAFLVVRMFSCLIIAS